MQLPRARRDAFVSGACAGDHELRSELLSLLEAHESAGDWFDELAGSVVAPALAALADPTGGGAASELPPDLRARLSETYRIERELSGAGMSRVLLAEDLELRRQVVLKVLPPVMAPAASTERFRGEIKLAAQLQHPHIVPLLTAEIRDGASYYTMPFVAGESLGDRIAREEALPVEEAVRIWRDVLDALAYAHAKSVIHRDIKPGNILLAGRNALVTDFGVARAVETLTDDPSATAPGLVLGTPAYMAPESVSGGRDADARVDIYQAGLVMYEMLTGRLPFAGSAHDSMRSRITQEPLVLARADVPEALRALVMRCIARLPGDRPPTAESVLAELDAALRSEPAHGGEPKRMGRRRLAALATAGAAAVLLVFVGTWEMVARGRATVPAAAATTDEMALAVLPLVDLDAPGVPGLAEGVTEELVSVLGRSVDLRVVGSTSVAGLQGRGLSLRQMADSLGVSHVLEGSLQRQDTRIRIQVRLVDARDGSTRWSETYDRELGAVFDVQAEIARGVARELAVRLAGDGAAASGVRGSRTASLAAHEWYLRGTDLALFRSGEGARQGIDYLRRAIELDGTYAAAYAGLATLYLQLWSAASVADRPPLLSLAVEAANRAAELDASSPEALSALGWVLMVTKDYARSEESLIRALALNPSVRRGHEGLARLYMMMGRSAEQLAEARAGVTVDPYSHSALRELALALATNGRCRESLEPLRPLKELTPPAGVAGILRGQCFASLAMWPEAIEEFSWAMDHDAAFGLAFLGFALARGGRADEARAILADLVEGRAESHGAFGIATVHAGLADYDQAFTWLNRAIDDNAINQYLFHPIFAHLHRDPRFEGVKARLAGSQR